MYGSTYNVLQSVTGVNGLLKSDFHNSEELLPQDSAMNCGLNTDYGMRCPMESCFLAGMYINLFDTSFFCFYKIFDYLGDFRVNEQPNLAIIHTLFIREHNRIAKELKTLNSLWSDEILFQETKRIVNAQYQYITYNEW